MNYSRKDILTDEILSNLLEAQKNMASAEKVDTKSLIRLSRFLLHLLEKLEDHLIQLGTENENQGG